MPMSLYSPPPDRQNTRTNTSDGGTEVGQHRGTSVAHLTFNGELSLDVDLSDHSSNHERNNTRQKENGGEGNDSNKFREHAYTHADDGIKIIRDRAIDYRWCQSRSIRQTEEDLTHPIAYPECIAR